MQQLVVVGLTTLCVLSNQQGKYTVYFNYVINLNYWETNTFSILLFSFFFVKLSLQLIIPCLLNLVLKNIFFISFGFQKKLLLTLAVGTVVLHPLGFYIFTIIFLLKFYFLKNHFFLLKQYLNMSYLVLFLTVTLALGSLWASQSNSWGYFWVNDAVEWLLLIIICYILGFLHFWVHPNRYNFFLAILIIINVLVLVRLNFVSTRHNFISNNSTIYILLFFYVLVANSIGFWSCFLKKTYKLSSWFSVCILSIYFAPLIFLKWYFFIFFFLFVSSKLNHLIPLPIFHLLTICFLTVWIIFFKFFFLNYFKIIPLTGLGIDIFVYSLSSTFNLFKSPHMFSILEFVNFCVDWGCSSIANVAGSFGLAVLLNNCMLIYLFILALSFITGWT